MIGLSCDKGINLCAVSLFGNKGKEYRVHLEIQSDGSDLIRSKDAQYLPRQIKSEMGSYPGFDVMFKPPIGLKANSKYWLIGDIYMWSSILVWKGWTVLYALLWSYLQILQPRWNGSTGKKGAIP